MLHALNLNRARNPGVTGEASAAPWSLHRPATKRGFERLNFDSPKDLFDAAFRDHTLFFADIRLRELAIAKFKSLPFHPKLVLFVTGMTNIRDVIAFPRFPGNAEF